MRSIVGELIVIEVKATRSPTVQEFWRLKWMLPKTVIASFGPIFKLPAFTVRLLPAGLPVIVAMDWVWALPSGERETDPGDPVVAPVPPKAVSDP